jgi:hypothetical protein
MNQVLRVASSLVAPLLLVAVSCSLDNTATGSGGSAGSAGNGTGGSTAAGGSSGAAGSTGVGGSSGSATGTGGAGTGGSSGSATGTGGAGTGGDGGTASGQGGAAGEGGAVPDGGGAAGSGGTGTAPDSSATGAGGRGDASVVVESGAPEAGTGAPPSVTSTAFGAFNNAFLIVHCDDQGSGVDCRNFPTGTAACPAGGNRFTETFTVSGGNPGTVYNVAVRVIGEVEPRGYINGARAADAVNNTPADPSANNNNLLFIGNAPPAAAGTISGNHTDYNEMSMSLTPPAGSQPIAGAPTYYAFNSVDAAHEGNHFNFEVDESFTMQVRSGYTVTLTSLDTNCTAIMNCGPGGPYAFGNSAQCTPTARTIPGITLPPTFAGETLPNGGAQPFQSQFLNFHIVSITPAP